MDPLWATSMVDVRVLDMPHMINATFLEQETEYWCGVWGR